MFLITDNSNKNLVINEFEESHSWVSNVRWKNIQKKGISEQSPIFMQLRTKPKWPLNNILVESDW